MAPWRVPLHETQSQPGAGFESVRFTEENRIWTRAPRRYARHKANPAQGSRVCASPRRTGFGPGSRAARPVVETPGAFRYEHGAAGAVVETPGAFRCEHGAARPVVETPGAFRYEHGAAGAVVETPGAFRYEHGAAGPVVETPGAFGHERRALATFYSRALRGSHFAR